MESDHLFAALRRGCDELRRTIRDEYELVLDTIGEGVLAALEMDVPAQCIELLLHGIGNMQRQNRRGEARGRVDG